MGRFAVIGLGKFGREVARDLHARGHEVVGIDNHPEHVQDLRDHTTQAIVADCTEPDTLKSLGIDNAEAVVVSLGERIDASVLVTLYLREMGVRRIITKGVSPDHGKVLRLVGATEVVLPERDTALRVASALGTHGVLEYLPLAPGFSLIELSAPKSFLGRTLGELEIRRRFHVMVVAAKNGDRLDLVPGAGYRIQRGDLLMLIGSDHDLALVTQDAG